MALQAIAEVCFAPKSGQTGRCLAKSALCQKRTHAPQQTMLGNSLDHLVGAGEHIGGTCRPSAAR